LYETDAELDALDDVVEKSRTKSADHLGSLFGQGEWISGRQIASHLQGLGNVALATVNAAKKPRVAPMEAILFHGKFYVALQKESNRVRQLTRNPTASLTYTRDDDLLIIVNGSTNFVQIGDSTYSELDTEWKKKYGRDVWDDVLFVGIEPESMIAFAVNPELYPTA
jgi:general stress protein 26